MTDKEKKAIELLEHIKNNSWTTLYIMSRSSKDAETLINLIEKQQKALEQKDKEIQELKEKWNKDTHTLQNQLDLANADRVEKDKIIKAMAKYINSTDKDEDVCRETGDTFNCAEYRNCEECIIEFFKKKARKENE